MPVRTTVVGSWWLHPDMEEELAHHHAGQLPPKESEAILNRAAAKAISVSLASTNGPAANTTPTSFETFVEEEFAPAYREQVAA